MKVYSYSEQSDLDEHFLPSQVFRLFRIHVNIVLSILQLWNELCDLIAKNPDKVTSLNIEPIIRQGLKRYTDQIGVLWNSMADYYIRGGHFERVNFFQFV